ncbi:MAG TPA: NAD(P)H-binding protein [Candidatus Saccharimonadales bacterium]|nr:NAD(P)H-binding protein [Candidatus Saccharimonadales bacterium]
MKLAVIAANGRSGKIFVERALAAGHSVRAGVHRANNLSPHEHLTVMPCDATNENDLAKLLSGQDAVVSFIGHIKGSPPHVQAEAMRALVSVMKAQNIRRVVSLTGTGVRFPGDHITLIDRILNMSIRLIDPARVRDGADHVEILKQSGLDWTVLRVLKLQNTAPKPFTLQEHGPTKWYVSREEVADAALQVLEQGTFVKQAPILSKSNQKAGK